MQVAFDAYVAFGIPQRTQQDSDAFFDWMLTVLGAPIRTRWFLPTYSSCTPSSGPLRQRELSAKCLPRFRRWGDDQFDIAAEIGCRTGLLEQDHGEIGDGRAD